MRAVVQRVSEARVDGEGLALGSIGRGLLVLVGVGAGDSEDDASALARKVGHLRIFEDGDGKMNRSVIDVGGSLLVVSQFTLWGDCRKGRRPSFARAAPPETAERLYTTFVDAAAALGAPVATGRFGATMRVHLVNDGPVTLLLDSAGEL